MSIAEITAEVAIGLANDMISLRVIALISIAVSIICAIIIAVDLIRHTQKMWIMNIVWPVTVFYSGPLGLLAYFTLGCTASKAKEGRHHQMKRSPEQKRPFWQSVLTGAFHCGSGCTLGDLLTSVLLLQVPVIVFGSPLYGEWTIDFILAFTFGIVFQYFAIKPMKNLSPRAAFIAALKADTLSLIGWQIGMYGWMAICNFLIFHRMLQASEPLFWFMMQIGMLAGLFTAYPVNWWLIKKGIKESM